MAEELPFPVVHVWRNYGTHAAWDECRQPEGTTVDDALLMISAKHGKSTNVQARSFRAGWRAGRVSEAAHNLQSLLKYLPAALINQMGDEMQALSRKYEAMLNESEQS